MQSEYTSVKVVARHIPDPNSGPFVDADAAKLAGYDTIEPVTGIVQIGVLLDGAFIPLVSEKASLVHDAIELAKQNAAAAAPAAMGLAGGASTALTSSVAGGSFAPGAPPPTPEPETQV